MTSDDVKALVDQELASWSPPVIEPGSTIGVPWDRARYESHIARLRAALVVPYRQRFVLRETYDQASSAGASEDSYWVVAVTPETILWFDEQTNDFGLATPGRDAQLPESIGVRGDIVGSFSAR